MSAVWKEVIRKVLPRKVRPYPVLGGPLQGSSLVTSLYDYPAGVLGHTEAELAEWFSRNVREGQVWMDVGAHYGYTALLLSRFVGPTGHVLAFEPIVQTVAYLQRTLRVNEVENVDVFPFALSTDERMTSRDVPIVRGMADHDKARTRMSSIRFVAWDVLRPLLSFSGQVDGIKIDVQGMEIETLTGMRGLLHEHHPLLVVELHEGVDRARFRRLLESAGYSSTGYLLASGVPATRLDDNQSYSFSPSTVK